MLEKAEEEKVAGRDRKKPHHSKYNSIGSVKPKNASIAPATFAPACIDKNDPGYNHEMLDKMWS